MSRLKQQENDRKIEHLEAKTVQKNEVIAELMLENHPDAKPRIISDNGPQFIAKDFKLFIRLTGITRVRTSPYYPQSNGLFAGGSTTTCLFSTWTITTTSGCTVSWAISRRPTN